MGGQLYLFTLTMDSGLNPKTLLTIISKKTYLSLTQRIGNLLSR